MAQNVFQFFIEPGLQEIYRDKATALPLSNGYIKYFKNEARTEPKPVYKLSGTPEDPVYVPLPNPLPLTGIGSVSDGFGEDIKPYYNPYDEDGNEELYYIEVWSETNVLQFTREGWPEQIDTSEETQLLFIDNYFQDGQFLNHIDVPSPGTLTDETTNLAYGGWIFNLPVGFTSENTVLFERFPDYVTNPGSNPRYSLRFSCVNPNPAESIKDLVWFNTDVNFLAGHTVTFQFEAVTNNGVPLNVNLFYQKNYGTGGSPTDTTFVSAFTISQVDWAKYTVSFTVSENFAKTIGPNNDDEIRFLLRFPSDVSQDVSVVNFILTEGQFSTLTYPESSNYQDKLNSLASSILTPAYDGSDVGSVLTLGTTTSTSSGETGTPVSCLVWLPPIPTGSVLPYFAEDAPVGYLLCDGTSYDLVGPDSSNAYNNLFNVIGFSGWYGEDTFIPLHTATATLTMTASIYGSATAPNPFTTGFTTTITTVGTGSVFQVVTVVTVAASVIPPGSYFEIFSPTTRSSIYWFSIDGLGADPSNSFPTSLVQKIELTSSDTADEVSLAIVAATNTQIRVPDLRGMFLRGWDDGRGIDPNAASRTDPVYFTEVIGDVIGSAETDSMENHTHVPGAGNVYVYGGGGGFQGNFGSGPASDSATTNTGLVNSSTASVSSETRPINISCNYIIKT